MNGHEEEWGRWEENINGNRVPNSLPGEDAHVLESSKYQQFDTWLNVLIILFK